MDDSASNRLVFRRALSAFDSEILEACNGSEALAVAAAHELLLILMDVQMPGMTGFDVASALRLKSQTAETPIIFVTAAYTDPQHLRQGYKLGAVDYLISKPIDEEFLRQKVSVYLTIFRHRRELESLLSRVKQENQQLYYENEVFREQQEDMMRQATQDGLTQLPNRMLFEDRLKAAIQRATRARNHFAVMFLDLDGLKIINDRYGHAAGDELLINVARRLTESLRGSDTVARLGGDEFGLLAESMDDPSHAFAVGSKIHENLNRELSLRATLNGEVVSIHPSASIGISLFPRHARTPEELLMAADLAMYQVKQTGGGVKIYETRPVDRS